MSSRRKPNTSHRAPSAVPSGSRSKRALLGLAVVGLLVIVAVTYPKLRRSQGQAEGGETEGSTNESTRLASPAGEIRREAGLDVLLITVDTLRADALGSYGRANAETQWMDRLASEGVRFEDAHAHNVLTLPSHANILSGLYPQEHGVRDNAGFRFPGTVQTLASVLLERGYRTAAFVSAFPLDSRFGLGHGFELYEDSFADASSRPAFLEQERVGTETVSLARAWLAEDDPRPSFAWVHIYEPHFPYAPPEPLATRFRSDPYQGDVAAADASLRPLIEPILAAGEAGNTLVVLTSDHGESLGEHGEATHGILAYESVLRVPLIFYQPRLLAPRVATASARHVDLMPTILDVLAIPSPDGVRGRSLLNSAVGRPTEEQPSVYFEALSGQLNRGWAPLFGVIYDGWKFIDLPIPELYDLGDDPAEADNLVDRELSNNARARLGELRQALEPLRRVDRGSRPSAESEEVRRRLSALGYLGGAGGEIDPRSYAAADDPKTLIGLDAILREVVTLYEAGDLERARSRCRELVRRRPGMRVALLTLAQLERDAGNLDAAVDALQEALALQPNDVSTLALLATYLTQAGRETRAVALTEPHARTAKPDVEVLLTRGLALAKLRRPQEAFEALRKAAEVDPDNPKVPVYLGTFYLMGGQRERARAAYQEALGMNPDIASAHSSLAIMAVEEGRIEPSLDLWRRAIASDEREAGKLLSIAGGLWNSGRRSDARPLFELYLRSVPAGSGDDDRRRVEQLLHNSS